MKKTTQGETLFYLIRDKVLLEAKRATLTWSSFAELLAEVGGTADYSEYMRGAVAVFAMRRLLRYRADERPNTREATQVLWRGLD